MIKVWVEPVKKQKWLPGKTILLITQIVFAVILLWVLAIGYVVINKYVSLNRKADQLAQLAYYDQRKEGLKQDNGFLKDQNTAKIISEVSALYTTKKDQFNQTNDYYQNLQTPYENFLQYFFLPPLNIWKDKYTGKIDETLIGKKYLEDNTYLDVNLISQWTDFFKNIGWDSSQNEIKSISIWAIGEKESWTFSIPIDVTFSAQKKRPFLLLVDKLSITSNRENVSLINDFFFNFWNVLKEKDDTKSDQQIGEELYAWAHSGTSNYVTDDDVVKAIRNTASCDQTTEAQLCYFNFREKMRTIPSLAYGVWVQQSSKAYELKLFLQGLPPLINVKSFVFQKKADWSYDGQISMEAYGKWMSEAELQEIATYLWSKCANGLVLSPAVAISQLDEVIRSTTTISQISNEKSKDLNDLREMFEEVSKTYDGLPWFQKAVQLFNIYRMLSENHMCQ